MSAHRGITTLKDVFPEIRKEYKRNFLRENKIKIKDIQKTVKTRQEIEKEKTKEIEKRKQKLQERLGRNTVRTPHITASEISSARRSKSSRIAKSSECVCGFQLESPPVSAKSSTSIDKEIQTEFDFEETYRNPKFIKNSDETINLPLSANYQEEADEELQRNSNLESDLTSKSQIVEEQQNAQNTQPTRSFRRTMSSRDQRRESSLNPFLYKEDIDYLNPHHELPKSSDWNDKFNKMKINDEASVISSDVEKKKSARSITSTRSVRSDIKLPKYLEKEKREKELHRLRELEKDPDCPDGFAILDENTRLENLEVLQRGFQSLIDELNRLPMSSVTLRVKKRKNEIEKDLVDLENKIRFYQKSKIFIKCPTSDD